MDGVPLDMISPDGWATDPPFMNSTEGVLSLLFFKQDHF
jgi:hypothetical protein